MSKDIKVLKDLKVSENSNFELPITARYFQILHIDEGVKIGIKINDNQGDLIYIYSGFKLIYEEPIQKILVYGLNGSVSGTFTILTSNKLIELNHKGSVYAPETVRILDSIPLQTNISNFPSEQRMNTDQYSLLTNKLDNLKTAIDQLENISVDNFPNTQTVQGNVNVSNFPSEQRMNTDQYSLLANKLDNLKTAIDQLENISVDNFPSEQRMNTDQYNAIAIRLDNLKTAINQLEDISVNNFPNTIITKEKQEYYTVGGSSTVSDAWKNIGNTSVPAGYILKKIFLYIFGSSVDGAMFKLRVDTSEVFQTCVKKLGIGNKANFNTIIPIDRILPVSANSIDVYCEGLISFGWNAIYKKIN